MEFGNKQRCLIPWLHWSIPWLQCQCRAFTWKRQAQEASQSIDRFRAGSCYSKTLFLKFRKFIYKRKYLYLFYCYIQSLFCEKLDFCLFCVEDEVPSVDLCFLRSLVSRGCVAQATQAYEQTTLLANIRICMDFDRLFIQKTKNATKIAIRSTYQIKYCPCVVSWLSQSLSITFEPVFRFSKPLTYH